MTFKSRIARLVSPRILASIDYMFGGQSTFEPWGGPLNGQAIRQTFVAGAIEALCEQIVETGTFRGSTTEWFARFGKPVLSVEANERYYIFAQKRLACFKNVKVFHQHSAEFLQDPPGAGLSVDRPTLFYLDAHWHDDLPIRDELAAIFSSFSSALIVIDDFRVPHDKGYGFDDYGKNGVLELDYIRDVLPANAGTYFPSKPATAESGARRGWLVISTFRQATDFCESSGCLRKPAHRSPEQC